MPVMDGVTATRALRTKGFKKPIVALTAHALKGIQATVTEAGFSDYLAKPITKERLISLLAKLAKK